MGDTFLKLRNVGQMINRASHGESRSIFFDTGVDSLLKGIDYREAGGSCLLGLNGNIIIAHGRSQAKAIKNAIGVAKRSVDRRLTEIIQEEDFLEPELLFNSKEQK